MTKKTNVAAAKKVEAPNQLSEVNETVPKEQYDKLLEAAQNIEKENIKLKSALSGISNMLNVLQ